VDLLVDMVWHWLYQVVKVNMVNCTSNGIALIGYHSGSPLSWDWSEPGFGKSSLTLKWTLHIVLLLPGVWLPGVLTLCCWTLSLFVMYLSPLACTSKKLFGTTIWHNPVMTCNSVTTMPYDFRC
jgi:hypothetical protein